VAQSGTAGIEVLLNGDFDMGLGLCLQCCGEFKAGLISDHEVRWAATTAPMMHQMATLQGVGTVYLPAPTCLAHMTVEKPPPGRGLAQAVRLPEGLRPSAGRPPK
jgi:hypothetical protein